MKLILVKSKADKKRFINFYKKQYSNNSKTVEYLSMFLNLLLRGKSLVSRSTYLKPIMIVEDEKVIMICILAQAKRMDDVLQISFFESLTYKPEAFKLLLDKAEELAKERGTIEISASLNIHVNYGLGFLASDYDKKQSFGMPYNEEFYHRYFEDNGFKSIDLISYKKEMESIEELFSDRMKKRLKKTYKVRSINFEKFKEEINLYTKINNKSFKDHRFYYSRDADEDMELFKDLKHLLREENILFVEREGQAVGFMLWYPDFNQIMRVGERVGVKTVIKNKMFSSKINTFKIVEIGVIPSERDKGAILALLENCFQRVKGRYDYFESSWILEDNNKSKALAIKWSNAEFKKYKAYAKDVR